MSLLDKASLIVTPNAYKESKLYSVVPNTTLGDMDVVRATTATRVNSAGLIEVVPRNLLTYSNTFNDASWLKSGVTITANTTIAPNGTTTASKIVENGTLVTYGVYKSIPTGFRYSHSIYAKKGERDWIKFNCIHGGNASVWFNLANGTIGTNYSTGTPSIENVGNGWYRCAVNNTDHSSAASFYSVMPCTNNNIETYTGTVGNGIFIWGAQLEAFSTATEYFPTTTRLNIPRIDYTNGSCPSLLVEPQRTNLYTYSQQLNQWSKSGVITVTENDEISPEGTQNADRAQFTLSTDLLFRSGTGLAGSNTLTVYAKAKSGTSQKFRFFGLGGGTFSSDQVATNQWQRFTFTYTSAATNTAGLSGASTGASDVLFYGFQHEIGAYATSYIPTVASSVTRNADVISKTGISSLIGQTEGTLFCDVNLNSRVSFTYFAIAPNLASAANYLGIGFSNNAIFFESVVSGVLQGSISHSNTSTGRFKIAAAYKANDFILYINGTQIGVDTSGNVPTCSEIGLSIFSQAQALNYNSVQLYKTRLTNSELASLTTL